MRNPAESRIHARTRTSYDILAADYADYYRSELAAKPLDRALLGGFAELVRTADVGPVADLGCGSGRVTAYLHSLGLPVFGVDLSPRMVATARHAYPGIKFHEGSLTALDLEACSLGGILAWYSIIHIPDAELPQVFAEFERMLAPGGYLQLAFQVGDGQLHQTEAGGHEISLDFYQRQPEQTIELVKDTGMELVAQVLREPDGEGQFAENTPQGFVLARKPEQEIRTGID